MTKLLPVGGIEHAIRRAFGLLGEEGVRCAIRRHLGIDRSPSLIRKCGDPDDDAHHLQMRYAVALDLACAELAGLRPFLETHRHLVGEGRRARMAHASPDALVDAVLALQVAVGDLASLVREAQGRGTRGGPGPGPAERLRIYAAIDRLEGRIETARRLVASV